MKLRTIGYETAPLTAVIKALQEAGVETMIDVRAVAASRRAGFSKRVLAASLAEAGIAYAHLPALGTPKTGRQAARAGRTAEMRAIFEASLAEPAAQLALGDAIEIARERPAALICYEADAARCHRRIVADHMAERAGFEVEDLTPLR